MALLICASSWQTPFAALSLLHTEPCLSLDCTALSANPQQSGCTVGTPLASCGTWKRSMRTRCCCSIAVEQPVGLAQPLLLGHGRPAAGSTACGAAAATVAPAPPAAQKNSHAALAATLQEAALREQARRTATHFWQQSLEARQRANAEAGARLRAIEEAARRRASCEV